jgi:WD40 repeat protein
VTFSETSDPCDARCNFRIATVDIGDGGRSGVKTYEGLSRTAADVEYSTDGSLFAALAVSTGLQSPARVALWRAGAVDPVLLDLNVNGLEQQPGGEFGAVKFSPDGSRLYASGLGPTVVFETATGQELHRIAGNGILAVSPDSRRVAVRDGSFAVRIIDSSGVGTPITVPLSSFPSAAEFGPDGDQIAIAVGSGVVIASTATGEIAETLRDHDGAVTALAFRATGELVTAGADGAIITWDVGDWSAHFRDDTYIRQNAFVQPDERTVTLEQADGMTRAFVAEPAVWLERACQIAGRVLTVHEWAEFLGSRPYAPACRD